MNKITQIDFSGYNTAHFKGWKEEDFINHELKSVPDSYGSDDQKKDFLKTVFEKITKANGEVKEDVIKK